ncbi:MAG TPA: hypothetical protein VLW50_12135 [Streptosporangiaceae bacterium]|nr:hypothetical protein [Streptosporangiaceae bacterium]
MGTGLGGARRRGTPPRATSPTVVRGMSKAELYLHIEGTLEPANTGRGVTFGTVAGGLRRAAVAGAAPGWPAGAAHHAAIHRPVESCADMPMELGAAGGRGQGIAPRSSPVGDCYQHERRPLGCV